MEKVSDELENIHFSRVAFNYNYRLTHKHSFQPFYCHLYITSLILLHPLHHLLHLLSLPVLLLPSLVSLFTPFLSTSFLASGSISSSLLHLLLSHALFGVELINHQLHDHIFFEEVERCSLVDCTLDRFFLLGPFHNTLLDGAFSDELVNIDISALAYSMGSVSSLGIHCWVPIIIVEDDGVSSSQCNPESS